MRDEFLASNIVSLLKRVPSRGVLGLLLPSGCARYFRGAKGDNG